VNLRDVHGVDVPAHSLLLATSASTGLWALDPQGKMLWRNKIPEGGMSAPVACNGGLVVATSRYGLFFLSPDKGRPIDGIDSGTGFSQVPAVAGNHVFIMSNAGVFYGLQIDAPYRQKVASSPASSLLH
jgi:outer membrane protein assembly factor BamB